MKIIQNITLVALLAGSLASCAGGGAPRAGQYAMGSDSAAIKEGRNRRESITSDAELHQHRVQRADTSEEMDLDEKKRRASLGGLRSAAEGAGMVRSILGGGWGY